MEHPFLGDGTSLSLFPNEVHMELRMFRDMFHDFFHFVGMTRATLG